MYRHSLFVTEQAVDDARKEIKDWVGEKDVEDLTVFDEGTGYYTEVRFHTKDRLSEYTVHVLVQNIRPATYALNCDDGD